MTPRTDTPQEATRRAVFALVNAEARADLTARDAAGLRAALDVAREVLHRWAPRRDALGRECWPGEHAPRLWAGAAVYAGMIRAALAREEAAPCPTHPANNH